MYTENNLDALYGGGGGGTTAVMPFTGITILYPLCYRENYVLGALSEKTVYVVLYQKTGWHGFSELLKEGCTGAE